MDLSAFELDELLLVAMKSEVDSNVAYKKLSKKVKNALLKDKLEFLANEEGKHREVIEDIFKNHFPDQEISLPRTTPVPLPEIIIEEGASLSKILKSAMDAEKAAQDFYQSLAERFEKDTKIENTLQYFAKMELGHYKLLEIEKENMEHFEEADVYWPMVHIGP